MRSRDNGRIAMALAAGIACLASAAHAGGLGTADQFAVLAAGGAVSFGNRARISPGALAQVGAATITLGNHGLVGNALLASAVSANAITLGNGVHVGGQCISGGGQITSGQHGGCAGGQDSSGQNPLLPVLGGAAAEVAAFAAELNSQNPTQVLGGLNLPAHGQATIMLNPGLNIIDLPWIAAGHGAVIIIDGPDGSSVAINVAGNLSLADGAKILLAGGITPDQVIINLGGDAVMGNGVSAKGALLAAGGKCTAGNLMKLDGAFFCTGGVSVRSSALLNFAGPFLLHGVYVANETGGELKRGSVTEYTLSANGNASPIAAIGAPISGSDKTQLLDPHGVAIDSGGNIYVTNPDGGPLAQGSVLEYKAGSSGNAAPIAMITGDKTRLNSPVAIALDALGNIYVANEAGSITKYAKGANGNIAPLALIAPPASGPDNTQLSQPVGVALDLSGRIYVANFDGGPLKRGSVGKFLPTANGNAAPIAVISAPSTGADLTGLHEPVGIAVDAAGNIYVANHDGGSLNTGSVTEYKAASIGNAAPIAAIAPASDGTDNTQLASPFGIALDPAGHIYVANFTGGLSLSLCASTPCGSVTKYRKGSTGNVAPIAAISPPGFFSDSTGIRHPFGIAIGR